VPQLQLDWQSFIIARQHTDARYTDIGIANLSVRLSLRDHGRRKRGYAGDLTPPTIHVGDIDMYLLGLQYSVSVADRNF